MQSKFNPLHFFQKLFYSSNIPRTFYSSPSIRRRQIARAMQQRKPNKIPKSLQGDLLIRGIFKILKAARNLFDEMSVSCGVESVVILGCLRWAWNRCTYVGADDSSTWPSATADEFAAVPRICRLLLSIYEPDLRHPIYAPDGGYNLDPNWVIKQVPYDQTLGHAPPYLIYSDHMNQEIVLAIRGLNLIKESDYKLLLDNELGMQMFDGGYVHRGLLRSAIWVLNAESETLKELWEETGRTYRMVFTGHSLGAGVAALLSMIVVNHRDRLGGIPRSLVRCYAVAPTRCMSLNLAVKYADTIHSIVLQDDFLPRTPTPLEDIFKSIFCLPCLLFTACLRDTLIPEERKLKDPRRLYAPGRIYHIVERKFCRCGRFPPEVRSSIPVDGRFEHIVLSCNATSDHAIIWIEREAEKALQILKENESRVGETMTSPPKVEKLKRQLTLEKEHKDALERAVNLNIPHHALEVEEEYSKEKDVETKSCMTNWNWDDIVVKKVFKRCESRQLLLNRDVSVAER